MQLERDYSGLDLIFEASLLRIASLYDEAKVERKLIACLHHPADVLFDRRAIHRCGVGAEPVST